MRTGDDPPAARVESGGASSSGTARPVRTLFRVPVVDLTVLLAVGSVYVALLTYLGLLRFDDFFTTNWDLGINQQMLWSTGHGHLLYESGDAEFYDVRSFLQVHSTYVAFLAVPLYNLAPVPTTLFILQGCVFVGSIFPLYLVARRELRSRLLVFCIIGLYLASFAVLSGLLYDFHWEAFIPLEFLCFFYLVLVRRYWWSLVPLAAGILTLEVFPFLAGGVAIFILYEELQKVGFRWSAAIHARGVRLTVGLLLAMGATYVALRLVQYLVIPHFVGYLGQPSMVSAAIGAPFSIGISATTLTHSSVYWLLLVASLAFLPLLAPKHLLLSIPWFVFSVLLTPSFSSYFGDQYALLAMATLSVAAVSGAGRLERIGLSSWPALAAVGVLIASGGAFVAVGLASSTRLLSVRLDAWLVATLLVPAIAMIVILFFVSRKTKVTGPPAVSQNLGRWRGRHAQRTIIVAAVICFFAFNLAMSPLNVSNFQSTPFPGYWFQYDQNPASGQMGWLTDFIPTNAEILASDFLFPFVANDVNAWALPWYPVVPGQPPVYFPFTATYLPRFVLIDTSDWGNLPNSIAVQLFNRTSYGLVAYIYSSSYPGTIYLFELGYQGQTAGRSVSVFPSTQFLAPGGLDVGPSGMYATNGLSRFGTVITSRAVLNPTYVQSCIWFGPYETLLPGTYTLTANLSGRILPSGNPSLPVLTMNGGPWFLPPLYNVTVYSSDLSPAGWIDLTWQLTLVEPYPQMEFRGYLAYTNGTPNGELNLNYLEWSR